MPFPAFILKEPMTPSNVQGEVDVHHKRDRAQLRLDLTLKYFSHSLTYKGKVNAAGGRLHAERNTRRLDKRARKVFGIKV